MSRRKSLQHDFSGVGANLAHCEARLRIRLVSKTFHGEGYCGFGFWIRLHGV